MEGHIPHSLEKETHFDGDSLAFIHYTCNAPSNRVLERWGISAVGHNYGCSRDREVLQIPLDVYLANFLFTNDQDLLNINLENLMRNLSRSDGN